MFDYLPPHLREQALIRVKGQKAIAFPSSYFRKAPYQISPLWELVKSQDQEGQAIYTAPGHFIEKFAKVLDRYEVQYEVFEL